MVSDDCQILPNQDELWVSRLRVDCRIWLCKEQRVATVAFVWEPPDPGHISGILGIQMSPGYIEKWFVKGDGSGLDGKQLILPIKGHLPDDPPPVPEPQMRHILLTLTKLVREVTALKQRVRQLENGI